MKFSALQIATLIEGQIEGDPDVYIDTIAKIEEARQGSLGFIANPKYAEYIYTTGASVVIVNEDFTLERPVTPTLIRVKDAYSSFALLLEKYHDMMDEKRWVKSGIEEKAYVSPSAEIGEDVYIGAFAYIGDNVKIGNNTKIFPGVYLGNNVEIGKDTTLFPGVKVYYDCEIGNGVIVHAGTVIGSDGFGFAPQLSGDYKKVPQIGNVRIEDHVEIGANATIDRATMGSTIIRKGVKLDNMVQIAHNVEVGENTVIAAQSGISGSTKIGKNCLLGGQVGIVGHIKIADGTRINAQSGVSKSTQPNTALTGSPAYDFKKALKSQAVFRRLPDLQNRVRQLENLVEQLLMEKESV